MTDYKCPKCPCIFETQGDLDSHLQAFPTERHREYFDQLAFKSRIKAGKEKRPLEELLLEQRKPRMTIATQKRIRKGLEKFISTVDNLKDKIFEA